MSTEPTIRQIEDVVRGLCAVEAAPHFDVKASAARFHVALVQRNEDASAARLRALRESPPWFLQLVRDDSSSSVLYESSAGFRTTMLAPV